MEHIHKAIQIAEAIFSWLFIIWVALFFLLGGSIEFNIKLNGIKPTIDAIKELFWWK